ncbi:MAG: Asp-tRNA(Asn)/Glu-tRNA(Gln) amidotransferase GatCAB subunit C [Rickettsiales bacterium]|nr:Asp-tRNA(Asn)/Glu-tRNA(Gln) amidotransferase GatCAB subunit C [Rickettsiales bacterium]OUV83313.1 MAG: aspartyl/glutamyl-tRNA(Asn/Gln) amidotransferase subunit C [Rickettsiales bacterium TMED131]|tara:strand:- start:646 stop:936 length:291 start_codon:yes stop_codon:yes gene_type:complete
MFIDDKITRKIADLAKLDLSDQEIKEYSKDLSNILKWMEELKEVDVSDIEPITSVIKNKLFEREDKIQQNHLDKEKIISNAPDKADNYFTVPKVIE